MCLLEVISRYFDALAHLLIMNVTRNFAFRYTVEH